MIPIQFIVWLILPFPLLICLMFLRERRFSIDKLVCRMGWPCPDFLSWIITLGAAIYILVLGGLGVVTFQAFATSTSQTVANTLMLFILWGLQVFISVLLLHQLTCEPQENNSPSGMVGKFVLWSLTNFFVAGAYGMILVSIIPNIDKLLMPLMAWNVWVVIFAFYLLWCACRCYRW